MDNGVSVGENSHAGFESVSLGHSAFAGHRSAAMGAYAIADDNSVAIGSSAHAKRGEKVIGETHIETCAACGTLYDPYAFSNVMEMLKSMEGLT